MTRRRWFPLLRAAFPSRLALTRGLSFVVALPTGFVTAPYWRPWCVNALNRIDWPAVGFAAIGVVAVLLFLTFLGGVLWGAVIRAMAGAD